MKKPLQKDFYRERRYGKKELTCIGIIVLIVSALLLGGGIALIVFGAFNPNGAWAIIWRVALGVLGVILGGILLSVGITMVAVTRSMINTEDGNVSDERNSGKGTINIVKCEKCGTKLSDDARFCKACGEPVELAECEACGKPIQKGSKFCEECGKGVKNKN